MAIKIFTPVSIEIEDKKFSVIYREPTDKDIKEIEEEMAQEADTQDKVSKIMSKIDNTQAKMRINEGIANTSSSLLEQAKVWVEQRSLQNELELLTKELENAPKKIDFTHVFKKRFELLVSGDDKIALEGEMKKYAISYRKVLEEIETLVREATKKK